MFAHVFLVVMDLAANETQALRAGGPRFACQAIAEAAQPTHQARDSAAQVYAAARTAINQSDYRTAAKLLERFAQKYSDHAQVPQALYFRAYSLYRAGTRGELQQGLRELDTLRTRYNERRLLEDAYALRARIEDCILKLDSAEAGAVGRRRTTRDSARRESAPCRTH